MAIRKASLNLSVGEQTIDLHYRIAGTGPAIVLLHPSPLSSAFFIPLINRLGDRATVIAVDTPGFGNSDPLPASDDPTLNPFVDVLSDFCAKLGLHQFAVYGSATGAQLAIEWAKIDSERISGVILDNAASFTDEDRAQIMPGYFPDVTPTKTGHHIAQAWQTAHDSTLFFPWHQPSEANRIAATVGPVAAIDGLTNAYLTSGPEYERAYRAAFENERVERAQAITVPTVIMRWQGSILKPFTDRFDQHTWAENFTMAHCGVSAEERWTCLEQHLPLVMPTQAPAFTANTLPATGTDGELQYADTSYGQVRYQSPPSVATESQMRLVIHELGESIQSIDRSLLRSTDIAVELPGHGESDAPADLNLKHCNEMITAIVRDLSLSHFELAGCGHGELIAQALVAEERRAHLVQLKTNWVKDAPPNVQHDSGGGQWWAAWHWLRAQYLQRNIAPPEPVRLTQMLLDLMNSRVASLQLRKAIV